MAQEYRSCKCKQVHPEAGEMARREFLKRSLAAGVAGALAARMGYADIEALYAAGRLEDIEAIEEALKKWTESLWDPGSPHVYSGDGLEHVAFPLGGIGAGQVYLTGRGRLTSWQIQNNFRTDWNEPGAFFAVRSETLDGTATSRLLHEDAENPAALAPAEAVCEYPFCKLHYSDAALPVDIWLKAYSPFEPLNAKDSGLPAALFTFTLKNLRNSRVAVSLLASLQNKIGWDGYTASSDTGLSGLEYQGNENRFERTRETARLRMSTRTGDMPRLDKPAALFSPDFNTAHLMRLCGNLEVTQNMDHLSGPPEETVYFLGPGQSFPGDPEFRKMLEGVTEGAALVLCDSGDGLLGMLGGSGDAATDLDVFEDFESGTYAAWQIEGECFGEKPAEGTLPMQQPVGGYRGRYLVNTYLGGDSTTGKATSRSFTITRKYIHFLIGGGNHPGKICLNLVVNGEVVRTATGRNEEQLRPEFWNVSEFKGSEGVLEIVDAAKDSWGHINVDHIVFSDSAASPSMDVAVLQACRDALPFAYSELVRTEKMAPLNPLSGEDASRFPKAVASVKNPLSFQDFTLKPEARILVESADGEPLVLAGKHGKGRVIVCNSLYAHHLPGPVARDLAGWLIALAREAEYQPQTGWSRESLPYGTLELAALGGDGPRSVSALPQWEDETALWETFTRDGAFNDIKGPQGPSAPGRTWNGALAAQISLGPNETREVTFVLAWHFPNRMRDHRYYWGSHPFKYDYRLGNKYNTWFKDAGAVTAYVVANFKRLAEVSRAFHGAFYTTTLPRWLLDAITANIANLRSPLYMWLEDGTVAAYEGTDCCCPMNCTHVFNYAMTPAFLFPELERNVRETDLLVQMHPKEHYIPHRTVLPLSAPRIGFEIGGPHHPALDGELGTLLKTCREWRQCGDTAWLKTVWPAAKTHLQYLMRTHDPDGTGVIRGEQPNTYDIHTYGSNTFIGSLYLAALRAMEVMANAMNDPEFARECRQRYETSRAAYDTVCWNGEYYYHVYDAPDVSEGDYNHANSWGLGCHADQLLGQWWANTMGLGHLLPEGHVRGALDAIYKHCWRGRLDLPEHHQRVFAEPWERGMVNCAWPRGGRPERPVLYCDEVWTGIEYEVAAMLMHEGKMEEALQIVKAARDRYTGNQRNPLSEIECGGHYARALSSYTLLLAAGGLDYDAVEMALAFHPKFPSTLYRTFLTFANGWGLLSREEACTCTTLTVECVQGKLELKRLRVGRSCEGPVEIQVKHRTTAYTVHEEADTIEIRFARPVTITKARPLSLEIRSA